MAAEIKRERKISSTETTVVGSLIEVFEQIQAEFMKYHPLGYGTRVQVIQWAPGDKFEARIERANSCD